MSTTGVPKYHPQLFTDYLTLFCVERELDPTTISKDEL